MLVVREASAEDKARALELTLESYIQYEEMMEPRDWKAYEHHIRATLTDTGSALHLIVENELGALIGSVLLYPAGEVDYKTPGAQAGAFPEIRLLAVPPAARGQGVGQTLMDACLEQARSEGAEQIGLHTMAPMEAARRMYERMGFRPLPELDFQPFKTLAAEAFILDL